MTLPIRLLPEARFEFYKSVDWYERQREGLGLEFIAEVRAAFETIVANPNRNESLYRGVRKFAVGRFPFLILYRIEANELLVISVFHTARDPMIWRSRT